MLIIFRLVRIAGTNLAEALQQLNAVLSYLVAREWKLDSYKWEVDNQVVVIQISAGGDEERVAAYSRAILDFAKGGWELKGTVKPPAPVRGLVAR